jgi:hypothetical protein
VFQKLQKTSNMGQENKPVDILKNKALYYFKVTWSYYILLSQHLLLKKINNMNCSKSYF